MEGSVCRHKKTMVWHPITWKLTLLAFLNASEVHLSCLDPGKNTNTPSFLYPVFPSDPKYIHPHSSAFPSTLSTFIHQNKESNTKYATVHTLRCQLATPPQKNTGSRLARPPLSWRLTRWRKLGQR